jgi:type II secretory pathway pseudopilin PulG
MLSRRVTSRSLGTHSSGPPLRGRGFTIIELIVTIGVIMILIGLSLPALSKSIHRAKDTRSMAAIRQCAIFFQWYAEANKEYYPIPDPDRLGGRWLYWPDVMARAGLVETAREVDPDGFKRSGHTNFLQSSTTMVHWSRFEPDATQPLQETPVTWIRTTDVSFPGLKGFLRPIRAQDDRIETTWCCVTGSPKGPVAWCDQSVSEEYWMDLLTPDMPMDDHGFGSPVNSTWHGVKGRDRWN